MPENKINDYNARIDRAFGIIIANKDFFITPLLDYNKILIWLSHSDDAVRKALKSVSKKLDGALTAEPYYSLRSNYFDALTGSQLSHGEELRKRGLQQGCAVALLALLKEKPAQKLVNTIISIGKGPVLLLWNAYQDRLLQRLILLEELELLLEKAHLGTLFKQRCLVVLNNMKQGYGLNAALSKLPASPYYHQCLCRILGEYHAFSQLIALDAIPYQQILQERFPLLMKQMQEERQTILATLEQQIGMAPVSTLIKQRCFKIIYSMRQGRGFNDALSVLEIPSDIKDSLYLYFEQYDAFRELRIIDNEPIPVLEVSMDEPAVFSPFKAPTSSSQSTSSSSSEQYLPSWLVMDGQESIRAETDGSKTFIY